MKHHRSLEITVISADGIKDVNVFGKMDVYAMVSILGYSHRTKKKTNVDTNCGRSPRWNHKMHLTIDERSLYNTNIFLLIQLKADKSSIYNKDIGEVCIPIPELFENGKSNNNPRRNCVVGKRVVEYQVKTSSGKPKGTLKFSYKFGEDNNNADAKTSSGELEGNGLEREHEQGQVGSSMRSMGYPLDGTSHQQPPPQGIQPPGYHQLPPGMGLPGGGYLGHRPNLPPWFGAYPPPGAYPPAYYGHLPPPGYGFQQPVQPSDRKDSEMGMGIGVA